MRIRWSARKNYNGCREQRMNHPAERIGGIRNGQPINVVKIRSCPESVAVPEPTLKQKIVAHAKNEGMKG